MRISANGIGLEIDDRGSPAAEPLVLIMGLGMQLIGWPDGLVDALVASGFRVIRFDNRDIGLSEHCTATGTPNLLLQALRHGVGLSLRPAYSLADMADDTAGLLDALGLRSAHVCGASMGGMIAQHLAARHPTRVRSLSLMMTSSGARSLPGPSLRVRSALMSRPSKSDDIDAIVDHYVRLYRLIGSAAFPPQADRLRQRVEAAIRRSYRPDSVVRQMMAIAADGDRSAMLAKIKAPTRIIHGASDPLIPVAAAHDLAAKIKGAELDIIDGMGHDLPEALWARFAANIRSAGEGRRSA